MLHLSFEGRINHIWRAPKSVARYSDHMPRLVVPAAGREQLEILCLKRNVSPASRHAIALMKRCSEGGLVVLLSTGDPAGVPRPEVEGWGGKCKTGYCSKTLIFYWWTNRPIMGGGPVKFEEAPNPQCAWAGVKRAGEPRKAVRPECS